MKVRVVQRILDGRVVEMQTGVGQPGTILNNILQTGQYAMHQLTGEKVMEYEEYRRLEFENYLLPEKQARDARNEQRKQQREVAKNQILQKLNINQDEFQKLKQALGLDENDT